MKQKDTVLLITNNGKGEAADPLLQGLFSKYSELIHQDERRKSGIINGMTDIIKAQMQADKVITL